MKTTGIFLIIAILVSCSTPKKEQGTEATSTLINERVITSFLGEPLPKKELPDSIRQVLDQNIATAKGRMDANPDSLDLIIWYGRRTAYSGRYFEAIDIYTKGLEQFPNSYRLLRHRGHRYISTRQLDKAIADFERANELSMDAPNAIEPDGIPNKMNKPLGNDKFNIYYHHALAYYLKGEFEKAIPVYLQCIEVSDNDDLLAATSYWLYMTYHRLGESEKATQILSEINDQMEIIENDSYLDLLLLFKGELAVENLLSQASNSDGVANPTMMYGIGNWYFQKGNQGKALDVWNEILRGRSWEAFGFIAAEAEIANSTSTP